MTTPPNKIIFHLNPGDDQFNIQPWENGFPDCDDKTRGSIPRQGTIGELPWSLNQLLPKPLPLEDMFGVRFQPLDGLPTPDFIQPYNDWGIRGCWIGTTTSLGGRVELANERNTLDILFATEEDRDLFVETFGTGISISRLHDSQVTEDSRNYNLIPTVISGFNSVWGQTDLWMLSVQDEAPGGAQFPGQPRRILNDAIDEFKSGEESFILEIEFTDSPANEEIMGPCEGQEVNPCDPVVPPECESDSDCTSCNSFCVNGTCVCQDCPCNSVCLDVAGAIEEGGPGALPTDPRPLIDGDQENCTDCMHPLFGDFWCSCQPVTNAAAPCRPERENCDCPPDIDSTFVCCENENESSENFGEFNCCGTQEFGTFGVGEQVLQCIPGYGCAATQCANDSHCPECKFCDLDDRGIGTCTPREDETPCGNTDCEWCIGGDCVENDSNDCNCGGSRECPGGFECCPEGHCCDIALGGCDGEGCSECDDDGDCVSLTGDPCAKCVNNSCQITDCGPCLRTDPNQNCDCVEGLVCPNECEDCVVQGENELCVENCPNCSGCGADGNCTPLPSCPDGEELNTETCECEIICLDCQTKVDGVCETDESLCNCCTDCIFSGASSVCTTPDDSLCPAGQVCVSEAPTCRCVTPECDPPCEGCKTCFVSGAFAFCISPQLVGLPDPCAATCQECGDGPEPHIGVCQNDTCPGGDCCLDGSCCEAGTFCCGENPDVCCPDGHICCGGGACCPPNTSCCDSGDGINFTCCEAIGDGCDQSCVDGACVGPEFCSPFCPEDFCTGCDNAGCDTECKCVEGSDWDNPNRCTCTQCPCGVDPDDPTSCFDNGSGFCVGTAQFCNCDGSGGGAGREGACCKGSQCSIASPDDCFRTGGEYQGDGTNCFTTFCSGVDIG